VARFPPGKGGGEGVARGGKGQGILLHRRTEGNGMPLAHCTTPANGAERAHVGPLLEAVKVHPGQRGRPRKRLLVVRWERIAACFDAFLAIATIHIWMQRLIVG
jgi:hypothetical protein